MNVAGMGVLVNISPTLAGVRHLLHRSSALRNGGSVTRRLRREESGGKDGEV